MVKEKLKKSAYLHMFVSLALMTVFRLLPPVGGITPYGMAILGIFFATIYGWVTSDVIWPSFMALLALVLTTEFSPSVTSVVSKLLGDSTVVVALCGQFVIAIVVISGVAEWVGRWFISRPVVRGRPLLMVAFIFLAGLFISPFIALTWMFFMFEFVGTVNKLLGYENKSRFSQILLYCIMFNAAIANYLPMQMTLVVPAGILAKYDSSFTLEAYPLMLFGLILSVVLIVCNFAAQKLVFRLDLSGFRDERVLATIQPPSPMSNRQKAALTITVSYLVLLFLASLLPDAWIITVILNKLGIAGLGVVAVIIAGVVHVDGKPIATFREISREVKWEFVFMPGTAILLAGAISSEGTGIPATLAQVLTPIFSDFSPYMFTLVVLVAAMLLTNLFNNIVVYALFVPIVANIAPAIGANTHAIFMLICSASALAVMFPSACPMAAFLHANTKQMEFKQIVKFSLVSMVTGTVVYALIGIPLANFFY